MPACAAALAVAVLALLSAPPAAHAQNCNRDAAPGAATFRIAASPASFGPWARPEKAPKPATRFNRYCFRVVADPLACGGGPCCSSAPEYKLATIAFPAVSPACSKAALALAYFNLGAEGDFNTTTKLATYALKAPTATANGTFTVTLKATTVIRSGSDELCLHLPDVPANPGCKTIDQLCGGAACLVTISTTKIKALKQNCCTRTPLTVADVNECLTGNGGCSRNAVCTNFFGGRNCTCLPGFSGDGVTCNDVNECATNNGGCSAFATCNNTLGGRNCTCLPGFTGNGLTCTDVNECATNNGGCSAFATCNNTLGGRNCTCLPGYSGDGTTCSDVDECATNNGGCSAFATCNNTLGGRNCTCLPGYSGDGITCSDVDECATNNGGCSAFATCNNTLGGRNCTCLPGYSGDGVTCTAVVFSCTAATSCVAGTLLTPSAVNCSLDGAAVPSASLAIANATYCGATATDVAVAYGALGLSANATVLEYTRPQIQMTLVGQAIGLLAAEQIVFDDPRKLLYVAGGDKLYVLDVSPAALAASVNLTTKATLDFTNGPVPADASTLPPAGASAELTDVAFCKGNIAVSVDYRNTATGAKLPGRVFFFEGGESPTLLGSATAGYLPDAITFNQNCSILLTANEAEPNSYGQATSFDPEGSIGIIYVDWYSSAGASPCGARVCTDSKIAGLTGFNSQISTLRAAGVRIYGPGASVAQDLEPEFVAFLPGGTHSVATVQEANALAIFELATATVTAVLPLGLKNHGLAGNALDASDRDGPNNGGRINIQTWPGLYGMYMPDEMAAFSHEGNTFVVTANEGDSRAYTGFNEEVRVATGSYVLDPTAFAGRVATYKNNSALGRLTVTTATGDLDSDGDFDQIQVFGARSFSVWRVDPSGSGSVTQAYDSGDDLEQRTSVGKYAAIFNSDASGGFDTRSDNKGPEPEGVALGTWSFRPGAPPRRLLFLALERISLIAVYDLTNPTPANPSGVGPTFQTFADPPTGLYGPEGLFFGAYTDPGAGTTWPLLAAAYESGTQGVAIYRVSEAP